MKKTRETEGLIRTLKLEPPMSRERAAEIIDIAMKETRGRSFSPAARERAIKAMMGGYGLRDQADAALWALMENSTAIERICA